MSDIDTVPLVFTIRPEGYTHRARFPLSENISHIRDQLSKSLEIDAGHFELWLNGEKLVDHLTLGNYAVDTRGGETAIELRVEYLETEKAKVNLDGPARELIQVVIDSENSHPGSNGGPGGFGDAIAPKTLTVEIVRLPDHDKKRFLGGWRKKTVRKDLDGEDAVDEDGLSVEEIVEYHNASSQTPSLKKKNENSNSHITRFHRDTQTIDITHRSVQSHRESGTQMGKPGLYIDDTGSKVLHPGEYTPAEVILRRRVENAVRIQCFVRGWFARRTAQRKKGEREERTREAAEEEKVAREEADKVRRAEVERRMRPRGAADFAVLHEELDAWRHSETQRIKQSDLPTHEKKAALALLLNKETKLLQTIDRLKIQAGAENRDERISKLLEMMAAPKRWQLSDGTVADVETPFTMRAKELMDLYNGLRLPLLGLDERLDVLLHVKWTVKEFDCNLTREIVELIDREADMLNRGRTEKALRGLRKRLSNLFLQFIQTPEFNPEAVRFQKVPKDLLNAAGMGLPKGSAQVQSDAPPRSTNVSRASNRTITSASSERM